MRSLLMCVVACCAAEPAIAPSYARGPDRPAPAATSLPDDFTPHHQPVKGGRVDWTGGYILAEGIGHPNGRESSEGRAKAMAMRAAELVAARNALAMARGIRLDAGRKVADIAEGRVQIEGIVRGHRMIRSQWDPKARPPIARVVLEVPLWGVRGVAAVLAPSERNRAVRTAGGRRLQLVASVTQVTDAVVVIDARGRNLTPCLFPVVVDAGGQTLYDIATPSADAATRGAIVRYVETKLTFEQLRADAGRRFEPLWFDMLAEDVRGPAAQSAPATSFGRDAAGTQPSRRRARQQIVVQATAPGAAPNAQLVITREDAERLRNSPEAAEAMRKGQVLIVVDASAAGTEGRAPFETNDALALLAREP